MLPVSRSETRLPAPVRRAEAEGVRPGCLHAFRKVLDGTKRRPSQEPGEVPVHAFALAAGASIPEGPARPSAGSGVSAAEAARRVERILIGTGPSGAEARIRIAAGPAAGAEVHLVVGPGAIEARLLTSNEGSRQTLALAMKEIADRLRAKGVNLRVADASERRERPSP